MPERTIDTELWDSDEWFQELDISARYLFLYLWTNDHCKPAGLFYITLATIASTTKIPRADLPDLLKSLEKKVVWYEEDNLIWVKNFIKRQYKSPSFLLAGAKSLLSVRNEEAIKVLVDYNRERYGLIIPYQRYKDQRTLKAESLAKTLIEGDPVWGSLVDYYEAKIGRLNAKLSDRLLDDYLEYGPDAIKSAADEAVKFGKKSLGYMEKILERQKQEGHSPAQPNHSQKYPVER